MLVLFDLDGFKQYNDAFGHLAGDGLLARLGARLEAVVDGKGAPTASAATSSASLFEPGRAGVEPLRGGLLDALSPRPARASRSAPPTAP